MTRGVLFLIIPLALLLGNAANAFCPQGRRFRYRVAGHGFNVFKAISPLPPRPQEQRLRRSIFGLLLAKSGTEIGIQMAQLLLDKKNHALLKKDLSQKIPFVPPAVLESCVQVVAGALTEAAPKKLKLALKPGGMERIGPELSRSITSFVMQQQAIVDSIPLIKKDEKFKVVETMVNFVLDFALRDARQILEAPEVRLEALEEERRRLHLMMGPWRLFRYRLRRLPTAVKFGTCVAAMAAFVYHQQGACDIVAFSKTVNAAWSRLEIVSLNAWKLGRIFLCNIAVFGSGLSEFLRKTFSSCHSFIGG